MRRSVLPGAMARVSLVTPALKGGARLGNYSAYWIHSALSMALTGIYYLQAHVRAINPPRHLYRRFAVSTPGLTLYEVRSIFCASSLIILSRSNFIRSIIVRDAILTCTLTLTTSLYREQLLNPSDSLAAYLQIPRHIEYVAVLAVGPVGLCGT